MSDIDHLEDRTVDELGLTSIDLTVLTIARYVFISFNRPKSQAWFSAFELAEAQFGAFVGPLIGLRVAGAVREMSQSRKSCFRFNSPACPCCRNKVTPGERYLMAAISAVREHRSTEADIYLMMATEGGQSDAFRASLVALAEVLPQP